MSKQSSIMSASDESIDFNRILSSEKEASALHYGILFFRILTDIDVPNFCRPTLKLFRDIMLLNVSIDLRRQVFEPSCFPGASFEFQTDPDFFHSHIDLLSDYSERISHPVVKARLAHLAWFLDPSRRKMGIIALNSYMRVISYLDQDDYSATTFYRSSNFEIVQLMYSTFRVLYKFDYPSRDSIKFIHCLRKFIQKFEDESDVFSFFRLAELMIRNSKSDINIIKGILSKFVRKRDPRVKLYHKAYAWRLLAEAYEGDDMNDDRMICTKKAVDIYIRLFDNCCKSRKTIESQVWLDTAIHCYQEFGDRRYADLYDKKRKNERSVLRRLSSIYSQEYEKANDFSVEVDVSNITLSEALYEFTKLAISPDPKNVRKHAKAIAKSCPAFGRLSLPIWENVDGIRKMSYSSDFRAQGRGLPYDSQAHFVEKVRRSVLVRDAINFYRSIIGYDRRISKQDIIDLIQHSPVVDPCFVDTISDGFDRYFKGDMTSAFYILTPLLEGIIRRALTIVGHDVTIYYSSGVQADRTISSIFETMRTEVEGIFGRATAADIERVFLSEGGPCLRHRYAHANMNDVVPNGSDAIYGMWLIWRLIALPLIPRWSEVTSK